MGDNYETRVGRKQRKATDYNSLLNMRSTARPDDGKTVGPWLTTEECKWAWNEGPCPCGGIMRWAEAGYVAWHRICDACGSRWDLHPLTVYVDRGTREPRLMRDQSADNYAALMGLVRPEHITDAVVEHGAIYGGWARRARFY